MTTPANPDNLTAWLRWVLDQREAEARLLCSLAGVSGTYLRDLLAEIDAKRRILDAYAAALDEHDGEGRAWDSDSERARAETSTLAHVVRLLALPHAGREGFREEWKP